MNEQLKTLAPCPFCGMSDKDSVSHDAAFPALALHNYEDRIFRVECEGCNAHGPFRTKAKNAIADWNKRK